MISDNVKAVVKIVKSKYVLMDLKWHTFFLMLILAFTRTQLFAQDQLALARKDSLSRLGARHICISTESYLIDSVLLVPVTIGSKVEKWTKGEGISFNRFSSDTAVVYIATDKTIILNEKVLTSKSVPISIEGNLHTKVRLLSESRLLKDYNIVNKNGGLVFSSR